LLAAGVGGKRFGVSAFVFGVGGSQIELHELRPEALDLLAYHRPHVVAPHLRTEPARRGDGLQPGDPRADHQDLGGEDGPGRRHQHGEELRQRFGRDEDRLVAGDVGLRRQRVHLCARLMRGTPSMPKLVNLARHQPLHELTLRECLQKRHQHRALAHEVDLVSAQRRVHHGFCTFRITSAWPYNVVASLTMRAPAFSKAGSKRKADWPAPVSTSTSSPDLTNAAAASGVTPRGARWARSLLERLFSFGLAQTCRHWTSRLSH